MPHRVSQAACPLENVLTFPNPLISTLATVLQHLGNGVVIENLTSHRCHCVECELMRVRASADRSMCRFLLARMRCQVLQIRVTQLQHEQNHIQQPGFRASLEYLRELCQREGCGDVADEALTQLELVGMVCGLH